MSQRNGDATEAVDRAVGQRIRARRKSRALSLASVAAATGLSIGFLSQIERGLSSPSLRALTAMADALGLGVAELLGGPGEGAGAATVVTRSTQRHGVTIWRDGIRKQVLAGGAAGDGAPYSLSLLEFDRGASSGAETYTHLGEEAGVVLRGRLQLVVGERSWTLASGDSFRFRSSEPHRFANASRGRTVVVIVNLHQATA